MKVLYFDKLRTLGLNDVSPLHKEKNAWQKYLTVINFIFLYTHVPEARSERRRRKLIIHTLVYSTQLVLYIYKQILHHLCLDM